VVTHAAAAPTRRTVRTSRLARGVRLVVVGALAVLFFVSFGQAAYRVYLLDRQIADLERTHSSLIEENQRLREQIRLLQQPSYIERVAREQLGLVRPGEIAVVLVPKPTPDPTPKPAP
jgi:cell division protein FtsL